MVKVKIFSSLDGNSEGKSEFTEMWDFYTVAGMKLRVADRGPTNDCYYTLQQFALLPAFFPAQSLNAGESITFTGKKASFAGKRYSFSGEIVAAAKDSFFLALFCFRRQRFHFSRRCFVFAGKGSIFPGAFLFSPAKFRFLPAIYIVRQQIPTANSPIPFTPSFEKSRLYLGICFSLYLKNYFLPAQYSRQDCCY